MNLNHNSDPIALQLETNKKKKNTGSLLRASELPGFWKISTVRRACCSCAKDHYFSKLCLKSAPLPLCECT